MGQKAIENRVERNPDANSVLVLNKAALPVHVFPFPRARVLSFSNQSNEYRTIIAMNRFDRQDTLERPRYFIDKA